MGMTKQTKILLVKSRSLVSKIKRTSLSLGVLYIASFLRGRPRTEVRILDVMYYKNPLKIFMDALREFTPDIVGISALTAESFLAHKMAQGARNAEPRPAIIFGGPYVSSDPGAALSDNAVDAAVIGEGVETFSELVEAIASEGSSWKKGKVLELSLIHI